jgi:HPt (histidine-containing phosphotransfer) domain-containing protein
MKPIMTENGNKIYDLTALIDMYSGNMDNVKGTLVIFIDQMKKDMTMLKQKFIENDFISVKAFAHRMKPNLKLFGMNDLHILVLDIEQAALESNAELLDTQLTRLYELSEAACEAMQTEVIDIL